MNVAIVGIGGIGGYLCGKLLQNKDISTIGVCKEEQLKALHQNGLTLIDNTQEFHFDENFFTQTPLQYTPFDLIIFCVKSYDLKSVAWLMSPCIEDTTTLFCPSSGYENAKLLKSLYPNCNIIEGCAYGQCELKSLDVVEKKGATFILMLGEDKSNIVPEVFQKSNIDTRIVQNPQLEIWKKYLFISTFGLLTSYYDKPVGEVAQFEEAKALLEEIVLIANEQGVNLSLNHANQALQSAKTKLPYNSTTALWRDIRDNKKSEIDALVGYLYQVSKSNELKTPTLNKLYQGILKKIS